MNRIVFMVLRNIFRAPIWLFRIWRMGRKGDAHTEQERYDYLRKVVTEVNRTGRVKIEVHGQENIPEENGFIIFPNHQGLFDVLAIIESCPHSLGIVAKKEAAKLFLVKQVIEVMHGISIDRQDIKESLKVISRMTEEVKQGRNYVIFAEGTRSKNENHILNFKAGTFKSAVNAKCPIVPMALIDSFRPFDINSIKKEKVQVRYLEPIYPSQYMGLKTVEIANLVHDRIQEEISRNISENE